MNEVMLYSPLSCVPVERGEAGLFSSACSSLTSETAQLTDSSQSSEPLSKVLGHQARRYRELALTKMKTRHTDLEVQERQHGRIVLRRNRGYHQYPGEAKLGLTSALESLKDQLYKIEGQKDGEAWIIGRIKEKNHEMKKLDRFVAEYVKKAVLMQHEKASPLRHLPVIRSRYALNELIGYGGTAMVWEAWDLLSEQPVAIKFGPDKSIQREYSIHKRFVHPNLVPCLELLRHVENDQVFTGLVMQRLQFDVQHILNIHNMFQWSDAIVIMTELLRGLDYMHTQLNIAHLDLKPANILLDSGSSGEVKLADFQLAKPADQVVAVGDTGTLKYLAPECIEEALNHGKTTNAKVDLWAAGIVFYQMVHGEHPICRGSTSTLDVKRDILQFNGRLYHPPDTTEDYRYARQLIGALLNPDPSKRPTAREALDFLLEHSEYRYVK